MKEEPGEFTGAGEDEAATPWPSLPGRKRVWRLLGDTHPYLCLKAGLTAQANQRQRFPETLPSPYAY